MSPGSTCARLLLLAVACTPATGCGQESLRAHEAQPEVVEALEPYGLQPAVADTEVATLRWHALPQSCRPAYRIHTEYEPDLMFEPDAISHLILGPARKPPVGRPPAASPLSGEQVFTGRAYYRGFRAEKRGVHRDMYLSGLHAGPTAPTAACMPRTWDPVEDALTLGWPKLTDRLTAVGESWAGLRVEGKCNRSACVDPQSGGGGPDNHHRTCVTMGWQNELAGIYEVGQQRVALIESRWTDGHGPAQAGNELGIWTERRVLFSLDHGRPVWAEVKVHHNFAQPTADKRYAPVLRTWVLESIDDCPGSLTDLGWSRPEEITRDLPQLQEALQAEPKARASSASTPAASEE